MIKRAAILTAAFLFAASGALAQDATNKPADQPAPKAAAKPKKAEVTLKVGDKAPALSIEKWVKGEQVTGFEKGRIYIVEFWATWCGPCVASMPHLSHLQKEYKDKGITIIGVTKEDPNNSLDQVNTMVKEKGDGMGYTVAWDSNHQTYDAYMKAAGQGGIPTSFVVDGTGTIVYIGHPMWLDLPLEKLTKNAWDPKAGMAEIEKADKRLNDIFMSSRNDPKGALAEINTFEKEYPAAADILGDMKYQLLLKTNDPKASEIGRKMVDEAVKAHNSAKLNQIAWGIVDPKGEVEHKDLDLALTAATKADELTSHKDAAILDTLARVYFVKGDTAKAIEIEKRAIENATGPMKTELEDALKEFEAKK